VPCSAIHADAQETTTIICTNSILADFTANIITDNVTIEYIMPAGACPAHFDTSPSDIQLIASADIIISLGWEPWLTSLLAASENTDAQEIRCSQLGEWNLPANAKTYVEKIRDELGLLLPAQNNTLHTNAQHYLDEITDTAAQLQALFNTSGYQNTQVICMEWQQEFLEWLGAQVTFSYGPPEGLSTQDMLNVSNVAAEGNIAAIVDNLQSGTDFGSHIASESGASHVIFTNFPGAVPGSDTYLEMITYNTQQLLNGIATYEYKQGDIASLESQLHSMELQRKMALVVAAMFLVLAGIGFMMYKRK
jgi:ABC-type Zn uptake system ZnuABC Zn-binding protein ZnuA